jgi:hypothetical protein
VLRVHGDPGAQLPAGSGIFRACDDVAAFERLLLSPPPPPPPPPAAPPHKPHAVQQHGNDVERVRTVQEGANVTIIADVVTVNGSAVAGAASGSGVTVAAGSHPRAHAPHAPHVPHAPHAVVAAPPSPPGPPPADGHVNLSIEDASGGEMRFRVPLSTPLHTLLDMYCTRRGVSRAGVRFVGPRGGQLNPSQTVRAAGLHERDVIMMEKP